MRSPLQGRKAISEKPDTRQGGRQEPQVQPSIPTGHPMQNPGCPGSHSPEHPEEPDETAQSRRAPFTPMPCPDLPNVGHKSMQDDSKVQKSQSCQSRGTCSLPEHLRAHNWLQPGREAHGESLPLTAHSAGATEPSADLTRGTHHRGHDS